MPIGRTLRSVLYVGVGAVAAAMPLFGPDASVDPVILPFGQPETEATSLDPLDSSRVTSQPAVTVPTTIVTAAGPAVLTVNAPDRTAGRVVEVNGWTNAGTRVFTATDEVDVGVDGFWSAEVLLVPGPNTVTIEAIGPDGRIVARELTIVSEAGDVPITPVPFSAAQLYRASAEADPYDYFSGTATPFSTVTVSSPYGLTTTPVDADGNWSTAIFFTAPGGPDPFPVTVTGVNGSAEFDFFYTSPS